MFSLLVGVITSKVNTYRWSDCYMLRSFIRAAKDDNMPLAKLSRDMKWDTEFLCTEISDMEKLLSILEPLEELFVRLGSESESTIHLVVPTIKVNTGNSPL